MCVPSKSVIVYRNNKLRFIREIKQLWKNKHSAFKGKDRELYKTAKYDFERAVRKAKADYKYKLENKLKTNDSRGVWQGLKWLTNYNTTVSTLSDDPKLPNSLNKFHCHFDNNRIQIKQPTVASSLTPPFVIEENEETQSALQSCISTLSIPTRNHYWYFAFYHSYSALELNVFCSLFFFYCT